PRPRAAGGRPSGDRRGAAYRADGGSRRRDRALCVPHAARCEGQCDRRRVPASAAGCVRPPRPDAIGWGYSVNDQGPTPNSQSIPNAQLPKLTTANWPALGFFGSWALGVHRELEVGSWELTWIYTEDDEPDGGAAGRADDREAGVRREDDRAASRPGRA